MQQYIIAITNRKVIQNQHPFSRLRRRRQAQGKFLMLHRRVHPLQTIQLRLASTRHLTFDARFKTTDIGFRPCDIILLRSISSFQCCSLELFLHQIFAVIAFEGSQMPAFHFQYPCSDIIKKRTVMTDYQ